jgi:hypothetical protein
LFHEIWRNETKLFVYPKSMSAQSLRITNPNGLRLTLSATSPKRRNRQMEALSQSVTCGAWKITGFWSINFDSITSSQMIENEVPEIPVELLHKR